MATLMNFVYLYALPAGQATSHLRQHLIRLHRYLGGPIGSPYSACII